MARDEFQKFLFVGFLDRDQLEAAIHDQYPNLSDSQIGFIHRDIDEMQELMTRSSQDITAGMVTISYEKQ